MASEMRSRSKSSNPRPRAPMMCSGQRRLPGLRLPRISRQHKLLFFSVLLHLLIVGVENSKVAADNTEIAFREEFGGDAVISLSGRLASALTDGVVPQARCRTRCRKKPQTLSNSMRACKIVRKMDQHILPFLAGSRICRHCVVWSYALISVSLLDCLDRGNIGNSKMLLKDPWRIFFHTCRLSE